MKLNFFYSGYLFLFIILFLILNINKKSYAACVGVDVNNHIALTGSHQPSSQENDVDFNASPDCFGNVTSSTNTSLGISNNPVNQKRNSTHNLGGYGENDYGVNTPNIFIPVENEFDIYFAPYDPEFMPEIPEIAH